MIHLQYFSIFHVLISLTLRFWRPRKNLLRATRNTIPTILLPHWPCHSWAAIWRCTEWFHVVYLASSSPHATSLNRGSLQLRGQHIYQRGWQQHKLTTSQEPHAFTSRIVRQKKDHWSVRNLFRNQDSIQNWVEIKIDLYHPIPIRATEQFLIYWDLPPLCDWLGPTEACFANVDDHHRQRHTEVHRHCCP